AVLTCPPLHTVQCNCSAAEPPWRYNTAMFRLILWTVLALGSAYGASCDRACLRTTLDQYLQALVKHDPSAAPLSAGFRQTENAKVMRNGTGLWQTTKTLGKLQRRYFDAVTEQAGYFGTLDEQNGTAI